MSNSIALIPWGYFFFLIITPTLGTSENLTTSIQLGTCGSSIRTCELYSADIAVFWVHVGWQFFAPLKLSVSPELVCSGRCWVEVMRVSLMEALRVNSLFTNLSVLQSSCPGSRGAGRSPSWERSSHKLWLRNKPELFQISYLTGSLLQSNGVPPDKYRIGSLK